MTGAAGFIGSALARELLRRDVRVVGVDDFSAGRPERLPRDPRYELVVGDVGRPGVLAGLLERHTAAPGGVEAIFHLAARVGVRAVLADPEGCHRSNRAGAAALAAAVEGLAPELRPRVLAASSSEVYLPRQAPLREGDPLRPLDGKGRWRYAASKRAAEELFDRAPWTPGRGPVHLRLFNVVGPGQDLDTGMVLPTFVEHALAGDTLPVHGDGSAVRSLAHVDDVARALADLLELEHLPAGPLNVGGTARTSVLELAREVCRRAGTGAAPELVDPRRHVGPAFEAVPWRVPCLARLEALGVAPPSRPLGAIVEDALRGRRAELEADRSAGRRPGGRRDACASPAS